MRLWLLNTIGKAPVVAWVRFSPVLATFLCLNLTAVQIVRAGSDKVTDSSNQVVTGQAAFVDYSQQHPGARRKLTVADLPQPYQTESAQNDAHLIPRPKDAWPQAPQGFKVDLYASVDAKPRLIRTAPNGDFFVAGSYTDDIRVYHGIDSNGKPEKVSTFATGLNQPFGIAFYPLGPNPQWVYIGNTDSVVRFPYHNGDLKASGPAQMIVPDIPGGGRLHGGGHWTRDIAFSLDGKKMYVSVGSHSNVDDADTHPEEHNRADVLEYNPDGTGYRIYAYGIRNAVGIAVNPKTHELWGSVNERDDLGDNLVPDYITHIQEGGFYGWPWYYMGRHAGPAAQGETS